MRHDPAQTALESGVDPFSPIADKSLETDRFR
jgi:hypothetical protein